MLVASIRRTDGFQNEGDAATVLGFHIAQVMDDYGLWCGYGEMDNYFSYCWNNGIFEKVLPADEYKRDCRGM